MLTLRPYQQAAVEAIYDHLRERDDNPVCVIPTAGGKSLVIATICRDAVQQWHGRVLLVTHVRELIEQNVDKILKIAPDMAPLIGINSAGLGKRDTTHPVIAAGIQSIYRRAEELGHFDLAIVDECHLIPAEGEGMYRTYLEGARAINPHLRVIGFTATPFRLGSGMICSPRNILNHTCFEVGVRDLIDQGYLCPLISKAGLAKVDTSSLGLRGGEFIANQAEELMDDHERVAAACREIAACVASRRSILIFAAGVRHARHVAAVLGELTGEPVGQVYGDTPADERDRVLAEFQAVRLTYLVNVAVLTTGFDAPNIDCIVLMRPTNSTGLYLQILGRGFRLHPAKRDCLVLDFAGNVMRHGPADAVEVRQVAGGRGDGQADGSAKAVECPQCQALLPSGSDDCPHCRYRFPLPEIKHDGYAAEAAVLAPTGSVAEYQVQETRYLVHVKRGAAGHTPRTMRVEYRVGFHLWKSEWVALEHTGFARQKAEQWWRRRSHVLPPTRVEEAVRLATAGALAATRTITVRELPGDTFGRIIACRLGEIPAWGEDPGATVAANPDGVESMAFPGARR